MLRGNWCFGFTLWLESTHIFRSSGWWKSRCLKRYIVIEGYVAIWVRYCVHLGMRGYDVSCSTRGWPFRHIFNLSSSKWLTNLLIFLHILNLNVLCVALILLKVIHFSYFRYSLLLWMIMGIFETLTLRMRALSSLSTLEYTSLICIVDLRMKAICSWVLSDILQSNFRQFWILCAACHYIGTRVDRNRRSICRILIV